MKKTEFEVKIAYIESYETLRNMFKCACRYVRENELENKEQWLMKFSKYFTKQKRKLDCKCKRKFNTSLLGIVLELRPDLVEDDENGHVNNDLEK